MNEREYDKLVLSLSKPMVVTSPAMFGFVKNHSDNHIKQSNRICVDTLACLLLLVSLSSFAMYF